jgi:hypothetical protein
MCSELNDFPKLPDTIENLCDLHHKAIFLQEMSQEAWLATLSGLKGRSRIVPMPVTPAQFRRIALNFPETVESAHMNHPDFRVRGKIFATLAYPNKQCAMVKLTPDQQEVFVADEPAVFSPVNGAWGRQGCTRVQLKSATQKTLRRAVLAAWLNAAPKLIAKEFEASH